MNSLDSILSGGGEAVSEQQTEENVTQAATEGESQTEQQTETEQTEGEGESGQRVPVAALQAERQKVGKYRDEVAEFRKALSETNASFERRMAELVEAVKPKAEPVARPDFFENPEAATRATAQEYVDPRLDQITQTLMANAQIVAGMKYGDDKVQEAEQAFMAAVNNRTLDPSDYQRIAGSPNRYAAAVQWHQRQQAQAEIGNDPAAYKAKVEAELREKILAEINGGQQQQQAQPAARVAPSNLAGARNVGARSGPAWSGPASLQDIFDRTPHRG